MDRNTFQNYLILLGIIFVLIVQTIRSMMPLRRPNIETKKQPSEDCFMKQLTAKVVSTLCLQTFTQLSFPKL